MPMTPMDTLALFRNQENILGIVCGLDLDQLVALFQHNGLKADLPDIVIFPDRCLLHHTAAGGHQQEVGVAVAADRNNGGNLLFRLELQQVHNGSTSGNTAAVGNLISL